MLNHYKSSSQVDQASTNLLISKSASNLLDPRIINLLGSPSRENYFNNMDITIGTDKENKRLAVDEDKLFSNDKTQIPSDGRDTHKEFLDIDSKVRQLHSELRRVLRTEDDQPTLILSDIWNTFDAVKDETIIFKLNCANQVPPI
jgi:hypothetical protein